MIFGGKLFTCISRLTEARDAAADLFALIIPSSSADPTNVPTSSEIIFFSVSGETLLLDAAEAEDDSEEVSSFESDSSLSESDSDPLSEL